MSATPPIRWWNLALPCLAFLALGTANAALIPWFEFPDEKGHIHYAQYLAREGRLPPMTRVTVDDGEHSVRVAFNPPLYYLIASRFLRPTTPYISPEVKFAPRGARGFARPPAGGWSKFGDLPARLAALRLLSLAFGMITIVACFLAGCAASPEHPAVAATMAWVPVAIPQSVSMSAAINNEGLAVALASLATLACVRAAIGGRLGVAALGGALLGAAMMAKVSAVALVPACAWLLWRGKAGRLGALVGLLATAAVAGPWIGRNIVHYGDPTGIECIAAREANRLADRFPHDLAGMAKGAAVAACTFFLCYGQLAVWLPKWTYTFPAGILVVAAAGWWRQRRVPRDDTGLGAASAIALACLGAAFLAYLLRIYSPQGRYLYVGMPFIAYLVSRGVLAWASTERSIRCVATVGCVLALGQMAFLLLVVRPAFAV